MSPTEMFRGGVLGLVVSVVDCSTLYAGPIVRTFTPFTRSWGMNNILYTSSTRFRIMVGCCFPSEQFEDSRRCNLECLNEIRTRLNAPSILGSVRGGRSGT